MTPRAKTERSTAAENTLPGIHQYGEVGVHAYRELKPFFGQTARELQGVAVVDEDGTTRVTISEFVGWPGGSRDHEWITFVIPSRDEGRVVLALFDHLRAQLPALTTARKALTTVTD